MTDKDNIQLHPAFLKRYNALYRAINAEFDIQNVVLAELVASCLENNGIVTETVRHKFCDRVPAAVFAALERRALSLDI